MAENHPCGLVLLAAGASTRMGRPKQLLPVGGRPLVRHAAEAALAAPVSPVVVVLGAHAGETAPVLDGLRTHVVTNDNWRDGMGTSIRAGVRAALRLDPALAAVIIALADQPGVPAKHFSRLITTWREYDRSIVASESDGIAQPPALFTAAWFSRLLALQGDVGARILLMEQRANLALVSLADAADLDTPRDYERFTTGWLG